MREVFAYDLLTEAGLVAAETAFYPVTLDHGDWSDIEALYNVLHSDRRTTDPAGWRAELEAVFDVDAFLEWLAFSAVIEHWDT